jgi:hypothetical protein
MKVKYISSLREIKPRSKTGEGPGDQLVGGPPKALPTKRFRKNLCDALFQVSEWMNSIKTAPGPFLLDEVDMVLQVDQTTKVNVVVADVGAKISGGIQVKWKRDESQELSGGDANTYFRNGFGRVVLLTPLKRQFRRARYSRPPELPLKTILS